MFLFGEGSVVMKEVKLSEIQERVRRNSEKNRDKIELFKKELENKDLKKGRVRPRHPDEQKVLNMLKEKKVKVDEEYSLSKALEQSLKEVQLMREGKLEKRNIHDFMDQMRKESDEDSNK